MDINRMAEHLKREMVGADLETRDFYSDRITKSILSNLLNEKKQPNQKAKPLKCYGFKLEVSDNNHILVEFPPQYQNKTVDLTTGHTVNKK